MHHTTNREAIERLRELIEDIDIAMLTTVDENGTLRSRPMGTQRAEFDGDLWFLTRVDTPKVDEIQRESRVNVIGFARALAGQESELGENEKLTL